MDLKNNYKKEAGFDLKEMFWRLLEQWKAIVVVALLVMALFLGFVHMHNANAIKKEDQANQIEKQVTEEEVLDALPENERSMVASAYQILQKRNQFSDYICTAPVIEIDPNHIQRLRVSWAVDNGDKETSALIMAYITAIQEDSCKKALLQASGADLNGEQFGTLMNVSFPNQLDLDVVSYDILLTENMKAEAVQKECRHQVESIHARLQNEFGEHRIVNYQSEIAVVADQTLYQSQLTALNGLVTINTQLNNLKNTFSAEQEKAFSKLQSIGNKQEVMRQAQPAAKSISLMDIIIGLILGVCAYVLVYFLYTVISNRMISAKTLQESSVRTLGEWHGLSEAKKKTLTRDRFVWRKHHKGHMDMDSEISKITDTIRNICSFRHFKALPLLVTAECSKEQDDFICRLADHIEENGIEAKVIKTSLEDRELIEAQGIVLVIIDSKTKSADLGYVFDRCNDYEKPIVGSVYLG